MKSTISGVIVTLLLMGMLMSAFNVQRAECIEPPETKWSKTYGGISEETALSVIQTDDGGYALTGRTTSFGAGGYDFWLVKTNSTGDMQWNRTYGTEGTERSEGGLIQTSDGGYLLIGHKNVEPNRDMWVVKTDLHGYMMWNQTYGGSNDDTGRGAILTDDGGYALFGNTRSFGAGGYDFWLVKTNSTGHEQWSQTYGGGNVDLAASLIQTNDGGYALAGRTYSFGAGWHDFWLVKTNSTGGIEWSQTYGTANFEAAYAVVQTPDQGYALAGQKGIHGSDDFWLVKTNATGHEQWNETYGGTDEDHAISMIQTIDEGYALAGPTRSFGAGDRDFWLVKTDLNGNMKWNQTYGEANDDVATSVIQTDDGGYAITGKVNGLGAGHDDFWLIKLAPEEIHATVDVDPNTLNLRSKGEWITGYIELPEGCDVADINVSSILLNDTIPAEMHPIWIEDEDGDGIPDLMVKFDRSEVISYILVNVDIEDKFTTITLTITGTLNDRTPFEGSDTIKIIKSSGGPGRNCLLK